MIDTFIENSAGSMITSWGDMAACGPSRCGHSHTVATGGIQFRHFGYIFRTTFFEPLKNRSKGSDDEGAITSFQALLYCRGKLRVAAAISLVSGQLSQRAV